METDDVAEAAGHPDDGARRSVAGSFAGAVTGTPDGPGIRALIALTRDRDPQVRDEATFTLGFQADADSPAIRDALWERTTDESAEVREEGIRGLARRRDPRAVPLLAHLLADPEGARTLTFAAAQIMGAPELMPTLLEYDPDDVGVTAALDACDPVRKARLDAFARELLRALDEIRPDLDASVYMERFAPGTLLGLGASTGASCYSVEGLLERAGGDPSYAAGLVASDNPRDPA
ncbi:HEAT repeat domain-containing protein [Streptomyces sp. NPDC127038]|uniref:HEAT repeat domain-containing protein n=1 Tax=Streptomyces sp. NPDC127038 TaxID=3347114 RepID=UPI0036530883